MKATIAVASQGKGVNSNKSPGKTSKKRVVAPFGTAVYNVQHPGDLIVIDRFAPIPKHAPILSSFVAEESSAGSLTAEDDKNTFAHNETMDDQLLSET